MRHVVIGYGEPLVEVRLSRPPRTMILDTPLQPGTLDTGVETLIGGPYIGFSGDILNAINAAKHILAHHAADNLTTLVTAVGDSNCDCSEHFIEWLATHKIDTRAIRRMRHGHMGAYVEGYRDNLGSFPYARIGAAFEDLTQHHVTDVIKEYDTDSTGIILSGITHARTHELHSLIDILEVAQQKRTVTFYCVNFRMSLWGKTARESTQRARDSFRMIAEHLDFCSLGKDEAEIVLRSRIANRSQAKRDAVKSILNMGIRCGVVLTGYPDAYIGFRDRGSVRIINHVADKTALMGTNTTGAGDNFTGALAALYLICRDIPVAFAGACQIAESSTTVEGGIYHPRESEITEIISEHHKRFDS